MEYFRTIILGQGIAGTTLAWHLYWLGESFLIIDRNHPHTSSQVAAGLITPLTGKRLAKSWRLDELYPIAEQCYQRISTVLTQPIWQARCIQRLFQYPSERDLFRQRLDEYRPWAHEVPEEPELPIEQPLGGFQMPRASQLLVSQYRQLSQDYFAARGQFLAATIDWPDDVQFGASMLTLPRYNLQAERLVCCEGWTLPRNPHFGHVPFQPAYGEILTLRIPDLPPDRVWNQSVWLAPLQQDYWRCGATYRWDNFEATAADDGIQDITARLRRFLRCPYQVVDVQGAVRPIHTQRHPLIGQHPQLDHLYYFNGLGSKGALLAPYYAQQLAGHLVQDRPLPPDEDVRLLRVPA